MKFVLNLLTLQNIARIAANTVQKSPHPNSHPLKNQLRALAVWHHFFFLFTIYIYLKYLGMIYKIIYKRKQYIYIYC